jgi:ribose transport system substrate-binding protein
MVKRRLFGFIILIVVGIFNTSCKGTSSPSITYTNGEVRQEKQQYVGIYSLSEIDYFTDHKFGLYKAAEYLGVDVEYLSSVGNDEAAMKGYFDRAISENVDGIILLGTAESCAKYIDAADEKGIPTVLVEGDIPNSHRIGVVSTNNFEAGRTGANIAVDLLNAQGQVGVLTQLQTNVHQDRLAGYESEFADYPEIAIVSVKDTYFSYEKASESVREMMREHPEIDLIVATDYYGGPSAVLALEDLGLDRVKIIAMDKSSMTIEEVKSGQIYATLVQQTALMSFYALRLLYDYNNANIPIEWAQMSGSEHAPIYIQTGVEIVTKDNLPD